MKFLVVTGSRHGASDHQLVALRQKIQEFDAVLHGGQDGVDRQADQIARSANRDVIVIPALWYERKRAAGPMRNATLAVVAAALKQAGHDVEYLALPAEDSSGTWDAANKLKQGDIRGAVVHREPGDE